MGQSINLVTTASDEDPKPKLIMPLRIGFCTAKSDIPETFYPEYHSCLILIQTVFANGEREGGERDWCRHVKVNIASADQQVEREREREREREMCVCVLFEFRQFVFFTLGTRLRISKFCVDLCKKKI